jgi:manganese efflux pump family protein
VGAGGLTVVIKLIALVLPLGLDTFAVAAALGVAGLDPTRRARVSLLMTSFEAGMPLVGLALGAPLGKAVGSAADYIAIGVLLAFGLYTLVARDDDEGRRIGNLGSVRGWTAVLLGLSISLDELAIGFTFGLLRLPALLVVLLIATQAFVVSQLGLRLGARVGARVREGAERVAGLALTALGLGLLIEKITAG